MEQRILEEEALGCHGLPIEALTPEQESDQWDFTGEATEEDWRWVDAFNGRPRGYTKQWTLEAELAGVGVVGAFGALKSPFRASCPDDAYWCSLLRITPGSYLQVVTSTGRVVGVKKKGHPR